MLREVASTRVFLRWYMIVSSVMLAGLAAVVVILLVQYSNVLGGQQDASIAQCRQNNVNRVEDIAIWDRLLTLTPAQAKVETAAQRAEVADLERLVRVKDTPRDCTAAYKP